jgi:hypothetical protein
MNDDNMARKSGLWRWVRRVLLALLITAAVGVVRYLYLREKYRRDLEEAAAEMDRDHPGWRLHEREAARRPIADADNGALCVSAAARRFPPPPVEIEAPPLKDTPANEKLPPEAFQKLEATLAPLQGALAEARRLEARENGRFPVTYARGAMATLLPHVDQTRPVARLLITDAVVRGQRGDLGGALVSVRAAINAGRALGDEPSGITQIFRWVIVREALESTHWLLGQGEPAPEDLARLQALLEKEERFPLFEVAVRGDLAIMHEMLDAAEAGDIDLGRDGEPRKPGSGGWFDFLVHDRLRKDHPLLFDLGRRQLAIAQLPPQERPPPQRRLDEEMSGQPKRLATLLFTVTNQVELVDRQRLAWLRCTIVALAAERHRRRHGRWPASLDELRPLVLAGVLTDPSTGQPLGYERLPDGVAVSAEGLEDEPAGRGPRTATLPDRHADCEVRLWDPGRRGRPAQPRPPDEVPP